MRVKLQTQNHLEFHSLKGGLTGSSEPALVKIPHCWKSHVTAHLLKPASVIFTEIAERRKQANADFEPPDMELLEQQRENRLKEIKMEEILKEILVYGFFILILFFLSYQQRDMESFNMTENLKSMFLGKFESVRIYITVSLFVQCIYKPFCMEYVL